MRKTSFGYVWKMNRFLKILSACFCSVLFLLTILPAAADFTLNADEYDSLSSAVDAIPADAGNVTVFLSGNKTDTEEPPVMIPTDRGITELHLRPAPDRETVSLDGITRICANGVPLTVGSGIRMDNASIYGGACVFGMDASLSSSDLWIGGTVGYVFGGGLAENGGTSIVTETNVTVEEGALVYFEVFGGGHASGIGSRVFTESANTVLSGETDYLLGAGYAESGGTSECIRTTVLVEEKGSVAVALFGGGSAADEHSFSSVDSSFTQLYGSAHWAFPGDFAFGGGETSLNRSGRLEILASGSVSEVYLGSFSSDPGSNAFMNTAELMNCGIAGTEFRRSQSADGGEAKTQVTAVFPCRVDE